jgi:hypothetical protein
MTTRDAKNAPEASELVNTETIKRLRVRTHIRGGDGAAPAPTRPKTEPPPPPGGRI